MSDRVRFTTNRPAVDADAYGFSGFPFRIFTPADLGVTVGDGTEYPFTLPLEIRDSPTLSCARMFHRGRKLDVDTDFTYTDGGGAHPLNPQTLSQTSGPTTELEIIQSGFVERIHLADTSLAVRMFQTNRWIVNDSGDRYPNFEVRSSVTDTVRLVSVDPGGGVPFITATFEGKDFTLYIIDSGAVSFNLTFFDLVFSEFWAYDNGSGSPVYDTATGLEI